MFNKKLFWKWATGVGVISVVAGTTIGFGIAFNDINVKKYQRDEPTTFGEGFFDKNIYKGGEVFLQNNILFPLEQRTDSTNVYKPQNLAYDFVPLSKKHISIDNIKSMIAEEGIVSSSDGSTTYKPSYNAKISFKDFKTEQEVYEKFGTINKELVDLKKANPKEKFGIYWDEKNYERTVDIAVYKLKKIDTAENMIDEWIKHFKDNFELPVQPEGWPNPGLKAKFGFMFSARYVATIEFLETIYWFPKIRKIQTAGNLFEEGIISVYENPDTKQTVLNITGKGNPYEKGSTLDPKNENDVYEILADVFEAGENEFLNSSIVTTWKEQIIPIMSSTFDYNTKELKYIIDFMHVDKNSELVHGVMGDYVKNPTNITRRTFSVPMKKVWDELGIPIDQRVDISNTQANESLLFNSITEDWITYISDSFVDVGLNIIGDRLQDLDSIINSLLATLNVIKKIKSGGIKITHNNLGDKDPLDFIFKEQYDVNGKVSTLLSKLIEGLNYGKDFIDPQMAWKTAFVDFGNAIASGKNKWKDVEALSQSIIWDDSLKELFHLLSSWAIIEPIIYERIISIAPNAYYNLENSEWLKGILNLLIDNDIISKNTTIEEIFADWQMVVDRLIQKSKTGTLFAIDKNTIEIGLSLLGKEIEPNLKKELTTILEKFLSSPENVAKLINAIAGGRGAKEIFDIITKDPVLIANLIVNNEIDEEFFKELGNTLFDQKLLAKLIQALTAGSDLTDMMTAVKYGFGNHENFKKTLTILDQGLGNVIPGLMEPYFREPFVVDDDLILKPILEWDSQEANLFAKFLKKGLNSFDKNETKNFLKLVKKTMFNLPEKASSILDGLPGGAAATISDIYKILDKLLPGVTDDSKAPFKVNTDFVKALITNNNDIAPLPGKAKYPTKVAWDQAVENVKTLGDLKKFVIAEPSLDMPKWVSNVLTYNESDYDKYANLFYLLTR